MTADAAEGFDLHGVVTVGLEDATPQDVEKVERQLGPLRGRLDRRADISVRFVDRATTQPLTYVRLGEAGFNDDGFFVLRGKGGVAAKAMIPFEQVGEHPQIICERAMPAVPDLLALINLTALSKGVLPLHASAFTSGSTGVLVTGWAKGGKTESLLACMAQGARYVGDEWVYLSDNGQMMGLPEPIRLWSWHLRQLPDLLRSRPTPDRLRLSMWDYAATTSAKVAKTRLPGATLVRKGAPVIGRQAFLQIPPADLFGAEMMALRGTMDAVVLVASHEAAGIEVCSAGPTEVSRRMTASLVDERAPLLDHYQQFRFAFPDKYSAVIDTAEQTERQLLGQFLDGRPTAKVLHPYPCDIAALGTAVMTAALDAIAGSRSQASSDTGGEASS